jgi:diacylglycerol kinase family enzyme
MKFVELIHNPKAGEGENTMADIVALLKEEGYDCSYSSTPELEEGKKFTKEVDLVVIAGGDGTVRKTAGFLLGSRLPLAILPMGTANNIAQTLAIKGGYRNIIRHWTNSKAVSFDVGKLDGLKKHSFFLEGLGFGVFPKLMDEIHSRKRNNGTPEENMRAALELLREIVLNYKARPCTIEIDDARHTGTYILVEVMNISSIGPNLRLVPYANPGDGEFEVVLIAESQRDQFAEYLQRKIRGVEEPVFFSILKAKRLKILWEGKRVHVDDVSISLDEPTEIDITLQPGGLSFLTGEEYGTEKGK